MAINKKGFTLLEVLISVSIFAIISTCLYSTFSSGIGIWRRQQKTVNINESVRYFFDNIARELRHSVKYPQPDLEEGLEGFPETRFIGQEDRVSFVTLRSGLDEGYRHKEIIKVAYAFNREEGKLCKAVMAQRDGFMEESKDEQVLIENISGIEFSYGTWDADT
ncbi:MAG: prepilin-type N-terminal cleavage/methylation domain-containing protein, partial [Candidatus Omnitrophota bacterium]